MGNEIQIFNYDGGKQVRFDTGPDGEPWPVGTDVAKVLQYKAPRHAVTRHCKYGTKRSIPTTSGDRDMVIIPESDVYRLIASSQMPEAKRFERWIFEEVLPAIRKTGKYEISSTPNAIIPANETDPILAMVETIRHIRQGQIDQEIRLKATEAKVSEHDDQIQDALAKIKAIPRFKDRSDAEKRSAVDGILMLPGSSRLPNRRIAEVCCVAHTFVAKRRHILGLAEGIRDVNRNGTTYQLAIGSPKTA